MVRILTLTCLACMLTPVPSAMAQLGGNYNLSWSTVDSGGGFSGTGALSVYGTIGQPDAGVMSGGSFRLTGGFWAGVSTRSACAADFNNDGAANSQDFFDFLGAFFEEQPTADFNRDGVLNSQDFFDFLVVFFAGC